MKPCCLEIWYETNLVIRMVTWEIMRMEGDDASKSQDEFFPISYTCNVCGNQWSNKLGSIKIVKPRMKNIRVLNHPLFGDYDTKIPLKMFNQSKKTLAGYIQAQEMLRNIK